jgi:hypothetical protein
MTLDFNLELVSATLQTVVIGLVIFRRIYRSLPLFSSYLVWLLLVQASSLYLEVHPSAIYQKMYLIEDLIDSGFMFLVLVELSMSVLNPVRFSLPRWTFLVVSGLLALAFVAIWPFSKPPGVTPLSQTSVYIIQLEITGSVLRILFVLALAGFSQLLSISWRDRELQIATGLGFYALVGLSVTLLHMNQGATDSLQYHYLDEIASGSYIVSVLYWIVSFAQKVPERREFTPQMQSFLLALAGQARSTRMAVTSSSQFKKGK